MSYLESFQVVDEDVRQPELVHQLQVDGDHGLLGEAGGVHVGEEEGGDLQPGLRPHHVEVRTELDTVLLNTKSLLKNVQSRPK